METISQEVVAAGVKKLKTLQITHYSTRCGHLPM